MRKLLLAGLLALTITSIPGVSPTVPASAAYGDAVWTTTPSPPGWVNDCAVGVAFDGDSLYVSRCFDPNIYRIDPITGALLDTRDTGLVSMPYGPTSMDSDPVRNGIWFGSYGCNGSGFLLIYFWDFDDDSIVEMFAIPGSLQNPATGSEFVSVCHIVGLALKTNNLADPSDDELWINDDVDYDIGVFSVTGALLAGYDVRDLGGGELQNGLEIAEGYLFRSGVSEPGIAQVALPTLNTVGSIPLQTGDRMEDLACDDVTFAPTRVLWGRNTPQGEPSDDFIRAFDIGPGTCDSSGTPTDHDGDGIFVPPDNCPFVANSGQLNGDRNFIDLSPDKPYNDLTLPNSDASGDACDSDDDNDGLSDADELAGAGCGIYTAPTNPLVRDSDGDRMLDGAECALGTDPNVINAAPAACTAPGDADADGVVDAREFCYYGTSSASANTDGDTCSDAKEIASINGDTAVTAIDLSQIAQAFGPYVLPNAAFRLNFDVTKDGVINAIDLSQVAQRFGPC